jgi:MtN3 and saliva related transmembrane protein
VKHFHEEFREFHYLLEIYLFRTATLHEAFTDGRAESIFYAAPGPDLRRNEERRRTLVVPMLSPERHMRWLRVFEPLMVITGIVRPLATIPPIFKLYLTHTQHGSGQSLPTRSIFALATLLWPVYGLLNRKPAIYVGNTIGLVMNLLMVNSILLRAGWTY